MNYLPDIHDPCPVCKRSWDGGGGRTLAMQIVNWRDRLVCVPIVGSGPRRGFSGISCPFCKTEWWNR